MVVDEFCGKRKKSQREFQSLERWTAYYYYPLSFFLGSSSKGCTRLRGKYSRWELYQKFLNFTRYFFPFLIKINFKSNIYALIFRFLIYEFCRRKKSQREFQLLERWGACYSIRYSSFWDRVQKVARDNILDENCIRNFQISLEIFFFF